MSADAAAPEALMAHTFALCRAAREAGLTVTQARAIDVFRALETIEWQRPEDYRLALRTNLVSSREDEILFDRVFQQYFGAREADYEGDYILARSEMIRGDLPAGRANEGHRDMLSEAEIFGAEEVQRRANLALRWDDDAPPLEQLIRELARRLATRPSRRTEVGRRGRRIDLRRSVRRNVRHGLDLLDLARVRRKTRRTRIVMLCDVSGSMDVFNPFLLQLMLGLQQALKNSRTVVFSTRTTEISALLRRRSVAETLAEVSDKVRHWSGGTDIGAALAELNRGILREGSARSTVLIVISDGYDNGPEARIRAELEAARRRIRTLVWINPMFGATTFKVRATGMKAALPYVDHFLPAFNARALNTLVRELGALR
ncbi:MAG: VWA domain-containing protein [Gammaproteobacteria bacterium]